MVFKAGLSEILYVREDRCKTATKYEKVNGLIGKKGIENNSLKKVDMYVSLNDYFEDLREEGDPFAAWVIREEFGLTMRDHYPD